MNVRVPFLDLKAQYATIRAEIQAAIERVVESQQFILGPEVEALEREVAAYCGAQFGIGVSSGTDALLVSLMALGVGPGDEVITTPYTFVATAMTIARLGAKAAFVDIEPAAFNLDASQIESKITSRTKAIVPVHLFGQMADMRTINAIAEQHGVPVIEDAAQAIGAERDGLRAGSSGTIGCLSFFPSKNLGAYGDAGMVLTNEEALAKRVRTLRNQGQEPKYFAQAIGGNFRLDAIQAAVLRAKLPHLDEWTEARQRVAATYRQLFAAEGFDVKPAKVDAASARAATSLVLPQEVPNARHVYNQFVIRVQKRDELRAFLADEGIATEVYYPVPMHRQACFASWGYGVGDFPDAERAAGEALAMPVFPEMGASMEKAAVMCIVRGLRSER